MDASTTPILEIGLILLAAVAGGYVARRVGLPAIVGYLAVGLAFSPFTPGYVADHEQLELLADVGVVLLLFEVGIEVDLGRLRRDHGPILWTAPVQVVLTTAIAGLAFLATGLEPVAAALVGLCVALSSSVVIVNITVSRRRTTDRPTEVALLGWSVVQDLVGVALAAILLAAVDPGRRSLPEAALGLGGFALVSIGVAWLLPRALRQLRDDHDLFLIASVGSGLALAGLGAAVFGVPLALAAFVGGLAVTESHEAAEARRRLRPFRDVFAVLFFVAIGTLIDPSRLGAAAPWIVLLLALVAVAKVGVAWALTRVARLEVR
ncbi:MAG TPA: cation:proton antiporter, partial [Candidatus Limnocylindrales bacterium]|nr:cation:proton antiporter [Candidatus Limnocylindrales bacterium]